MSWKTMPEKNIFDLYLESPGQQGAGFIFHMEAQEWLIEIQILALVFFKEFPEYDFQVVFKPSLKTEQVGVRIC